MRAKISIQCPFNIDDTEKKEKQKEGWEVEW